MVILNYANDVSLNRTSLIRTSVSNAGYYRGEIGSPTFYSLEVNLPLLNKQQYNEVEAELITSCDGVETLSTNLRSELDITTIQGEFITAGGDITSAGSYDGNTLELTGFNNGTNINKEVFFHTLDSAFTDTFTLTFTPSDPSLPSESIFIDNLGSAASDIETNISYVQFASYDPSVPVTDENQIRINYTAEAGDATITASGIGSSGTLLNLRTTQPFQMADGTRQLAIGDYLQFDNNDKVYQVKSINHATSETDTRIRITLNTPLINPITAGTLVNFDQDINFKFLLTNSRPTVTIVPGPGYNYYQYDTFNFREVL